MANVITNDNLPHLSQRQRISLVRLDELREAFTAQTDEDLRVALGDHTCIYVTGSGGRAEMSETSDLDAFIVRSDGEMASRLDGVLIQAGLLRAQRQAGFPEPSRDGAFLEPQSALDFLEVLGSPEDDAQNRLTPRMLLLLESAPLAGQRAYDELLRKILDRYWELGGLRAFLPTMLLNDIIRYWRILLLNHEAALRTKRSELSAELRGDALETEMRIQRQRRSLKLRHARCMTCFATVAYLLERTRSGAVMTSSDAFEMAHLTPVQRLQRVGERAPHLNAVCNELLRRYDQHLHDHNDTEELRRRLGESEEARTLNRASRAFADQMFELIRALGEESPLYRFCVI